MIKLSKRGRIKGTSPKTTDESREPIGVRVGEETLFHRSEGKCRSYVVSLESPTTSTKPSGEVVHDVCRSRPHSVVGEF